MLGTVLLIVAAWGTGGWILRGLGETRVEVITLRMFSGFLVVALVSLSIGSVRLSWAVAALVVLAALSMARQPKRSNREYVVDTKRFDFLERVSVSAIALIGAFLFLASLAPVTSWDAGVAHLALPSDYVRLGRITLLDGNVYSAYPQALHSIFAVAYYISGERAVSVLCWCLGLLACGAVFALGRRLYNRKAGLLAAVFLITSPFFLSQVGTVAIDMPFAGIVLAALLCIVCWQREQGSHWLILAGLLVGFGCGVRHPGYVAMTLCAIGIFWSGRSVKPAALFLGVATLSAMPWLIRSYLLVGNPVYPLLETVFPQNVFAVHQVTEWGAHETVQKSSLLGFAFFSFDLVMHPDRFDGWSANPGGWIWILGIPGVILGGRVARGLALFSLLGLSSLYVVQRLARYGAAFFVPMIAVAGVGGSRLSTKSRALTAFITAGILYGCVLTVATMYFKIPVAVGMESRDEYLLRRVDRYAAFQRANEVVPPDSRVLTIDLRSYYLDAATYQNIHDLAVLKSMSFPDKVAWLHERGIDYAFIPIELLENTPLLQATGVQSEIESWINAPDYFRIVDDLEIDRARGEGRERIVILEVLEAEGESK